MTFGVNLDFLEETKSCDICCETKTLFIRFPQCSHYVCTSCFRTIYPHSTGTSGADPHKIHTREEDEEKNIITKDREDDIDEEEDEDDILDVCYKCPFCRRQWKQPWNSWIQM